MRKILVVDDTTDSRVVLARLLRLGGFQTTLADSGPSALTAIAAARPDLVVLDLMMPDMNGIEVLENLRQDPRFKTLPVVLYTAIGQGELIDQATRLGINDIILKAAINGHHLIERIERVLDSSDRATLH